MTALRRPPAAAAPNAGGATAPLGWMARAAIAAVRGYQRAFAGRPSPCRFWPSCSDYALEAFAVHGAGRGGWLVARRLGRCRPFGGSGVDLVPESGAR